MWRERALRQRICSLSIVFIGTLSAIAMLWKFKSTDFISEPSVYCNCPKSVETIAAFALDSVDEPNPGDMEPGGKHIPCDMLPMDTGIQEKLLELSGPIISQDNPDLIHFLRDKMIDAPRPYKSKLSSTLYKTPQAEEVDKILEGKRKGFFVECGAFDGEKASNTIWLENKRKWTGLLIEMDPSFYLQIRGKNRKSHSINACLSPKPYPTSFRWREDNGQTGKLFPNTEVKSLLFEHETFCFPFFSLMLAMNVSHIDYFSLDVEGVELQVLKTIPFDKIDISVISVEYLHGDKQGILDFMEEKGYKLVKILSFSDPYNMQYSHDYVYVKNGFT